MSVSNSNRFLQIGSVVAVRLLSLLYYCTLDYIILYYIRIVFADRCFFSILGCFLLHL